MKIFQPPSKNNGPSLIWPIRVCAAERGMVFRVLSFKQGIQVYYSASWKECVLERKPLRECEGCRRTVYICRTASAAHLYPNFPWVIAISIFSKIQLVVYYQRCVLIGWATTTLYSPLVAQSAGFENQNNGGWIAFCLDICFSCFVSIFLTN